LNLDEDSDGLRRERIGVEQIQFGGVGNWSQFRNKITFYPVIEGAYVNTKIWYRKESDLWVQPGEKDPSGVRKVSPEKFGKRARGRQFASVRQGNCLR
jgi:hypothetical protein